MCGKERQREKERVQDSLLERENKRKREGTSLC
jgi:hypothetical protein